MNYITKKASVVAIFIAILSVAVFAAAANYSLFGDAELVNPGNNSPTAAQIRSSAAIAPNYGGIEFNVPTGLTIADLDWTVRAHRLLMFNITEPAPGNTRHTNRT